MGEFVFPRSGLSSRGRRITVSDPESHDNLKKPDDHKEGTKTSTLDESIESTPRPIDARTMKAIVQYEYGSDPKTSSDWRCNDLPAIGGNDVVRCDFDSPSGIAPWHT